MHFDKQFNLSKIIPKNDVREYLNNAHLDTENSRLIATDGEKLVIIPVTIDDGDTSGPVSTEAIKAAIKAAGKTGDAGITCKTDLAVWNGATYPRPENYSSTVYPNIDRVIPKPAAVHVSINARMLADVQAAMGCKHGVNLQFAVNSDGSINRHAAVRVTAYGDDRPLAVIMPLRA
jgi:hypothetical protein